MVARLESSGRRWWSWWWWTLASADPARAWHRDSCGEPACIPHQFCRETGTPRNPSLASKGASLARAASILP